MVAALSAFVFSGLALRVEIGAITVYQQVGSPLTARVVTCRFEPSCSHYGLQVLRRDGFFLGNGKICLRLLHCSPLGWVADLFLAPTRPGPKNSGRKAGIAFRPV